MSSRAASYRHAAGLRLRPVPEMEFCLAFTAADPNIYTLNVGSWLAVELCDGRPWSEVEAAYVEAFADHLPAAQARRELRAAVADLLHKKVLEPARSRPMKSRSNRRGGTAS